MTGHVMQTVDLFLPECMSMDLQASTKWGAIHELAVLLEAAGRLNSVDAFEQAVRQREDEVSTGVGFGIGIPHGRSSAVRKSSIAFGRSRAGIPFDAIDGEPVHLVFLLAIPETMDDREYLGALSRLARWIVHEEFRNGLMSAESIEDVMRAVRSTSDIEIIP